MLLGHWLEMRARILGIFPTHCWPAEHTDHEAAVRASLVTALRHGVTTDARTAALVSLLFALKAVHKAVDPDSVGLSKRELNASAKRDWAAKAVRSAIDSRDTAIIVAATSSRGFAGGGGGS